MRTSWNGKQPKADHPGAFYVGKYFLAPLLGGMASVLAVGWAFFCLRLAWWLSGAVLGALVN